MGRWKLWLGIALFTPVAVLVPALGDGPVPVAVGLAAGALAVPGWINVTAPRGRADGVRLRADARGVEFPARVWAIALMVPAILAILVMFAVGVFVLLGWLGWVVALIGSSVVTLGVTAWVVGASLRAADGPGGSPGVGLDLDGVAVCGWLGTRRIAWDDHPVPVPYLYGAIHFYPGDYLVDFVSSRRARAAWWFRPHPTLGAGLLTVDHAAVAAAVVFYRDHPVRRVELASAAAVERIRHGQLPPAWPEDV